MMTKSPSEPKGSTRLPQINWDAVDLSRPTPELIRELSQGRAQPVTRQHIHAARKSRGLKSPDPVGGYRGPSQPSRDSLALTAAACHHLRALAHAAKVSPSEFLLGLPLPAVKK